MTGRHIAREGGAVEPADLGSRIRREADLSSRAGQMLRLYDLADEADTLRAQLEAAERVIAKMIDCAGNEQLARFIEKHGEPVPLVAERDAAIARAEAAEAKVADLSAIIDRVISDTKWRSDDNTLWPDLCASRTKEAAP